MNYLVVGLGNPGEQYEDTRHNTGRMFVDFVRETEDFSEWENEKKAVAQISKGKLGKHAVFLVQPDTFMNKSGSAVAFLSRTKKVKPEQVVVVYDDIDLPLGSMKISFDRGSGGHRGLESVIKQLKTREFVRIRIGVSGATPKGKTKKPQGEEKVMKHLLGAFKKDELTALKKIFKKAHEGLGVLIEEGRPKAMSQYN